MESNDSPEIPDRGETSDIPGLPSGDLEREQSLAVAKGCRGIPSPTSSFKERTFELWVINRWGLNFCVRIAPTACRGEGRRRKRGGKLENIKN